MKTEWKLQGSKERKPLHYTWCGLDDVYLRSGFERIKTADGEDIVIHKLEELHRAIADRLARYKKALKGNEVRFLRGQMDLSQRCLGKILRVTDQTVARWEKDQFPIPGPEEMLLRLAYVSHTCGNVNMQQLADELADVDDSVIDHQVFEKTDRGWHAIAA